MTDLETSRRPSQDLSTPLAWEYFVALQARWVPMTVVAPTSGVSRLYVTASWQTCLSESLIGIQQHVPAFVQRNCVNQKEKRHFHFSVSDECFSGWTKMPTRCILAEDGTIDRQIFLVEFPCKSYYPLFLASSKSLCSYSTRKPDTWRHTFLSRAFLSDRHTIPCYAGCECSSLHVSLDFYICATQSQTRANALSPVPVLLLPSTSAAPSAFSVPASFLLAGCGRCCLWSPHCQLSQCKSVG